MTSEGLPVLESEFHSIGRGRLEGLKKKGREGWREREMGERRNRENKRMLPAPPIP
jgi:hypothetical protein